MDVRYSRMRGLANDLPMMLQYVIQEYIAREKYINFSNYKKKTVSNIL
jgi:hypothetical protein